jgi:hypothetical protein
MTPARDLFLVLLLLLVPLFAWRALRPPRALGPPGPVTPCDRPVELPGDGVACLPPALHSELGPGDRLGGGRMAPARLAAWAVPVDLNRASLAELASLDGVGPKLASRIAAGRPYRDVDEVARVRGIGPRRLERLRERLVTTATGRADPLDE